MISKLDIGKSYHNSGGDLFRSLSIACNISLKNIMIFDSEESLRSFGKVWNFITKNQYYHIKDDKDMFAFLLKEKGTYFMTKDFLELPIISEYEINKDSITLKLGGQSDPDDVLKLLSDFGYKHSPSLSHTGTFCRKGDIIDIIDHFDGMAYRISFFGSEIDELLSKTQNGEENYGIIKELMLTNLNFTFQKSKEKIIDNLDIIRKTEDFKAFALGLDFYPKSKELTSKLGTISFFDASTAGSIDLEVLAPEIKSADELADYLKMFEKISIYTKNRKTVSNFIDYNGITGNIKIIDVSGQLRGLESFKQGQELFLCDDILSSVFIKKRSRRSVSENIDLMLEIKPSDYIVHIDHGIGIFKAMVIKDLSGIKREYLEIAYAGDDKLFVPISELHRVSKYIGDETPKLTRLNSQEWQKTVKKTEKDVELIAEELLGIYAKRSLARGYPFIPFLKKEEEFAKNFQYTHTFDQTNAIREIFDDMESEKPTDRLLIGDVGFGKTEVACNAIYKCLLNGKQAAFISPLVILAYEHFDTVMSRFAGLGYRIEVITRVEKKAKVEAVLQDLATGKVNLVIGTHRLLSDDVRFKNLGLLVIDEEHRLGVLDKEKISKIRLGSSDGIGMPPDILSLSATPIPRSLNMALSGIKDISIIQTPPPLKKPIKTVALRWSDEAIVEAIKHEFARGGQVIFIHNRIATIDSVKTNLEKIIGGKVKIVITHGQMNGIEVEDRILDFRNGKYDILLSTTVIENGVNFLNANTIIIDEADKFGLSQLHQLRGRVGRKDREGFCYLAYRNENLPDDAKKRLVTIINNSQLGAGFEIAMRDLEIRGAGDILGIKQSGKTNDVGISLYLRLLEDKMEELKAGVAKKDIKTQIELGLSFYISDDFFESEADKLHFFRSMESIDTLDDLDFTYETFSKGKDELPLELDNLFVILRLRICLGNHGVISLKKAGLSYVFEFDSSTPLDGIRGFLDKFDRESDFALVTVHRIKVETKKWHNDLEFARYLLESV